LKTTLYLKTFPMNIIDQHVGIEAFFDTICSLDTCVLASLSLVNNDWWFATQDELHNRRLILLRQYFPFLSDGWYCTDFRNIHIDDTFISTNALLKIGKLLQDVSRRKPHTRHPSYDCLFDGTLFEYNVANNKEDSIRRSYNTLFFLIGCAIGFGNAPPSENPRNFYLRNVCIMLVILQYCSENFTRSHSKHLFTNESFLDSISVKMRDIQRYMEYAYLPIALRSRIENIVVDLRRIMK
jgi:hypothetical protein